MYVHCSIIYRSQAMEASRVIFKYHSPKQWSSTFSFLCPASPSVRLSLLRAPPSIPVSSHPNPFYPISVSVFTALVAECDRVESQNLLSMISLVLKPSALWGQETVLSSPKMYEEQTCRRMFPYTWKSFSGLGTGGGTAGVMKAGYVGRRHREREKPDTLFSG